MSIDYVGRALNDLILTLGIRDYVDQGQIVTLIQSGKIKETVDVVASCMGLPISANISYVQLKPPRVAQILIPFNLPLYGSPKLANFPINIQLSEACTESPERFIAALAHELSHVVLYSTRFDEKENEIYTDLTAMILGFADFMRKGRKIIKTKQYVGHSTIKTSTLGYLSDDDFNSAFYVIDSFLNNQRSTKKELLIQKQRFDQRRSRDFRILSFVFTRYLQYVDKHPFYKCSENNGRRISALHRPDYPQSFKVISSDVSLEKILKYVENLDYYTEQTVEIIRQCQTGLKLAKEELATCYSTLRSDVSFLGRHVSFSCKLKTKVEVLAGKHERKLGN